MLNLGLRPWCLFSQHPVIIFKLALSPPNIRKLYLNIRNIYIFYFPRWKYFHEKKRRKRWKLRILLRGELWYWGGRTKTKSATNHLEKTRWKQKIYVSNLMIKFVLRYMFLFIKIKLIFTKIIIKIIVHSSSNSGSDRVGVDGGGRRGSQHLTNALC